MSNLEVVNSQGFATGADIEEIIEAVAPVLSEYPPDHQLIACLTICLIMLNPTMEFEVLQRGVNGAADWISKFVVANAGVDWAEVPSTKMN